MKAQIVRDDSCAELPSNDKTPRIWISELWEFVRLRKLGHDGQTGASEQIGKKIENETRSKKGIQKPPHQKKRYK